MSNVLELNKTNFLELLIDRIDTPIGEMVIIADRDGNLRAVDWTDHDPRAQNFLRLHYGPNNGKTGFTLPSVRNPSGLSDAIRSYFAGDLTADTFQFTVKGTDTDITVANPGTPSINAPTAATVGLAEGHLDVAVGQTVLVPR